MRGTVYRQCWCRDPDTGRKLHGKCPQLGKRGHGRWYYRYEAPRAPGERRRQPVGGPFGTRREAEEELADAVARVGGGGAAPDRSVRVAAYLDGYLAGKVNLKARTLATDREAFELYWKPALGHMRLVDVRARHVAEAVGEMMRIGQVSGRRPEILRRMLAARYQSGSPPRPLSPARVGRMFAPFRAAMHVAVKRRMIAASPCDGVDLPRADKVRPLAWTPAREEQFRGELARRSRGRRMTSVERQALWASSELRPCPAMVWLPEHTGRFLDSIAGERLAALFVLTAYCGLRRDEVIGLSWGEAWADTGLVFTREDGTAVPGQWVSVRFETLAFRAGLPPVRFHDLRHGAASQYKAAGLDTKYISAMLGHARTSFTDDVYVTLFPDVARAAAEAAAAIVERKTR